MRRRAAALAIGLAGCAFDLPGVLDGDGGASSVGTLATGPGSSTSSVGGGGASSSGGTGAETGTGTGTGTGGASSSSGSSGCEEVETIFTANQIAPRLAAEGGHVYFAAETGDGSFYLHRGAAGMSAVQHSPAPICGPRHIFAANGAVMWAAEMSCGDPGAGFGGVRSDGVSWSTTSFAEQTMGRAIAFDSERIWVAYMDPPNPPPPHLAQLPISCPVDGTCTAFGVVSDPMPIIEQPCTFQPVPGQNRLVVGTVGSAPGLLLVNGTGIGQWVPNTVVSCAAGAARVAFVDDVGSIRSCRIDDAGAACAQSDSLMQVPIPGLSRLAASGSTFFHAGDVALEAIELSDADGAGSRRREVANLEGMPVIAMAADATRVYWTDGISVKAACY